MAAALEIGVFTLLLLGMPTLAGCTDSGADLGASDTIGGTGDDAGSPTLGGDALAGQGDMAGYEKPGDQDVSGDDDDDDEDVVQLPPTSREDALVVLNELSASGDDAIELFNRGATAVDLSGWWLCDDIHSGAEDAGLPLESEDAFVFPDGVNIAPGEFFLVEKGDAVGEHLFGLAKDGEVVTLLDAAGDVVDQAVYGEDDATVSWCRLPDGDGDWDICSETFGETNAPFDGEPTEGLCPDDEGDLERPEWWSRESHCPRVGADYDYVFPDDVVRRLDIVVDPTDYAAAMADLDSLLGSSGFPGPAGDLESDSEPMWFPCGIEVDGRRWTHVGMRFKGNSSLRSAYQSGVKKLAFRMEFDKYEADDPRTDDQRFYGFEEMTFSNAYKDPSLIRDKLAADIFRDAGVPAARGAFVRVWVDVGDGPVYWGLYTMIEDVSDKLLDEQFGDDDGNLYKPEDTGAAWDRLVLDDFEKKTNQEEADWSDIEAAYNVLHAANRTSDPASWREDFEALFDVDGFLRWLSLNQTMVNWDTYGTMTHNYYVYADPESGGRLCWIPWDLNEAMLIRSTGGGPGGPMGGADTSTSLDLATVRDDWPLIRFLLDDDVYWQRYHEFLVEHRDGAFLRDPIVERAQAYHDLIAPWVVGADGESAPYSNLRDSNEFETSLSDRRDGLVTHIDSRRAALEAYLGSQ